LLSGGVDHRHPGQIDAFEQVTVVGVGEQDLGVDLGDVTGQGVPAASGVDTAQHITAEPGGGQRGEHAWRVAQQRADVQGSCGVGECDERGGLATGLGDVFAPGPGVIAVFDRGGVQACPGAQQLLQCVRHARAPPCLWTDSANCLPLPTCSTVSVGLLAECSNTSANPQIPTAEEPQCRPARPPSAIA
jgi:hypothetical protein